MAIEFDDRAINLIGNNARHLNFYDDSRQLRASIFLDGNNQLNIGQFQVDASGDPGESGGGGPVLDLANVPFLTLAGNALLSGERIFKAGSGLQAVDGGPNANYTLNLQTPGTLSSGTVNNAAESHTHAVTATSAPLGGELLKASLQGGLVLQVLDVDNIRLNDNTIHATGDLTLSASDGDVVLPSTINIGADNFVSQLTGWRVTYAGEADFRFLYADELHVKAFIADIEQALAGGQIISKSVAMLSRDFKVPLVANIVAASTLADFFDISGDYTSLINPGDVFDVRDSTANDGAWVVDSVTYNVGGDVTRITVTGDITDNTSDGVIGFRGLLFVEDLPGFEDTQVFTANDWIRLRVIDRSGGGLVVADVWGTVFDYTDLSGGEQRWQFRARDDGGVPDNVVNAGATVLDYGQSGDGFHEVTALDPDGPYAQIVTWQTDPMNPANYTLHSRLGNLDGVTDAAFPTIGGWGLYSDNSFLKGELWAANGTVIINDNGLFLDGSLGEGTASHIRWTDGQGGPVALSIGATVDTGGNIDGALIQVELGDTLAVIADEINAGALVVDNVNSRVGIGTASPSFNLDVVANSPNSFVARFFNDGNNANRHGVRIQAGQDSNPTNFFLQFQDGDGNAVVGSIAGNGSGGVTYNTTSDERTKQDVTPLLGALEKVLALEPIRYRGKGAAKATPKRPGLVAQQVRPVIPEVVTESEGLLGLDYMGLVPYLIGAIHNLAARLDALEMK